LRGEVVWAVPFEVEPSPCGEGATALDRADGGVACEEFLGLLGQHRELGLGGVEAGAFLLDVQQGGLRHTLLIEEKAQASGVDPEA
jgi:hypothetical protein